MYKPPEWLGPGLLVGMAKPVPPKARMAAAMKDVIRAICMALGRGLISPNWISYAVRAPFCVLL